MAHSNSSAVSRRSQLWCLFLLFALTCVIAGCSPQGITMLLMPWMDDKIAPEYKLFSADKEIKLVILSNFAIPESDLREDVLPTDSELVERLAQFMRKRCQENKHKLKLVPQVQVQNFQRKDPDASPMEIGKHFKADFVLDLAIQSVSLCEKNCYPKMFRGNIGIAINLYKVDAKDDERRVFDKDFHCEYPGSRGPIDAGNTNPTAFRGLFLTKVARDISKIFIGFPPDENHVLD